MEERMTFKVKNNEGKEIEYEVLFTFQSDETNKNYMVYTDDSKDENGKIRVYASSYVPGDEVTELFPIETEKEWKIIDTILNELQDEVKGETSE